MTSPAGTAAIELVEADVRELLVQRELAVDDDALLHRLLDEVVDDYRDRYLSGGLPSLPDDDVERLRQRIVGFGAITPFLEDPDIEEIWINEPGRVFVARHGDHELTGVVLDARDVEELVSGCWRTRAGGWTAPSRSWTHACPMAAGCMSRSRRSRTTGR